MIFKMILMCIYLWGCIKHSTKEQEEILGPLFTFFLESKKEIKLS